MMTLTVGLVIKKEFFFEKKNQKTFVHLYRIVATIRPSFTYEQTKAFCFFFSKKKTFLP